MTAHDVESRLSAVIDRRYSKHAIMRANTRLWKHVTHDKRRFILSLVGVMFAAILMFMQLGFLNATFDSQTELIRRLNADLIMTNRSKYRLGIQEPFARRRLEQARAFNGVTAALPVYIERSDSSLWKNPLTHESWRIRVIGIRPNDAPLLISELMPFGAKLNERDTALIDTRSKRHFGPRQTGVRSELAAQRIHVVGTFELGTDFDADGTIIVSERNFLRFFPEQQTSDPQLGRVELGLIQVAPGVSLETARKVIEQSLPDDVRIWTKSELMDQEIRYWRTSTPIGFIFSLGLAVGFVVGVVICSQILYTSVTDQMPLFGMLKAIGYTNRDVIQIVMGEALMVSLLGFLPSIAVASVLYDFLASIIGFAMYLTLPRILLVMGLTIGMSLAAAALAIRKAITADPAEVFK
jgi:putative ABC transport system permease protein